MTSPLGFKARVGSALFAIFAEANVMYIPQDSPLVLHLPTSWRPAYSRSLPHMHVQRWDLARFRTCDRTNRRRTRYHCASDPAYSFQNLKICQWAHFRIHQQALFRICQGAHFMIHQGVYCRINEVAYYRICQEAYFRIH